MMDGNPHETVGQYLRRQREAKQLSVEEISRATRLPLATVRRIESDQFDELPGEVFIRGSLRSYAGAVGTDPDTVLARYAKNRKVSWVTPVPLPSAAASRAPRSGRVGVAVAFVVLLFLFALALSIILKPRTHSMPQELSHLSLPPNIVG